MRQLLESTTAYAIFKRDVAAGRASHAYMLYFQDEANLRFALKYFAMALFETDESRREGSLIMGESFSDVKIYPAAGKKPSVADADEISADSALQPIESDKKLYIFTCFDEASALVQNKLLKLLEEPPRGVYFLLGTTSLAPILQTVRSRVKLLEIEPFSEGAILSALNRAGGDKQLNALAAASCSGIFGQAQAMVSGGWFKEILSAANEVTSASTLGKAGDVSLKYADVKEKTELLRQVQRIYFQELKKSLSSQDMCGSIFTQPALLYAVNAVNKALEDLKFNADFSSLLFDLTCGVITENDKWKKLLV